MATNLGIKKTHQLMKDKLIDYITSQYFGENQLLLNSSDELLRADGNLYQKPYIESTPSYAKIKNGISIVQMNSKVKTVFQDLIASKLGVFDTPFQHQIEALDSFVGGKNLFVATGTGSGKTECFIWPILYKIFSEAISSKNTWEKRGIRTILVYPMNALVSDQISRLRAIIGDEDNKFVEILEKNAGKVRRPQFGMYTGRTPYPGPTTNTKNNSEIADSFEDTYLITPDLSDEQKAEKQKDIDGLKKIHKYPSKNMKDFVASLKNDTLDQYDSSRDAELVLRYEMQQYTPDILITNYSMLEYMLIRKVESNIWDDTRKWLSENPDNKLLIVIDEAHMYSGASGGEVALLIRRLFSKLGIIGDKVQFIITSASMPNETEEDFEYIKNFAESLSGCEKESFCYLFGKKESFASQSPIKFDVKKLAEVNLDASDLTETAIQKNISNFAKTVFDEINIGDPQKWFNQNFSRYKPFVDLVNVCRGNAVSIEKLQQEVIGDTTDIGSKAFENLLLLAPLAKDQNGNVLFPARIHLFFRGLNGIYACTNPKCSHPHSGDDIHLGSLFTNGIYQCPFCGSKVFEIINDRRCGALFLKTFINKDSFSSTEIICWPQKGIDEKKEMISFPLFILPDGYDIIKRPKDTELAYFDVKSGKLYAKCLNEETCIRVLKTLALDGEEAIFKTCPKCGKRFTFITLSDFKVKGNLPFYNIIKAQFDSQPMTKTPSKFVPNGGKKVLLFSDSRQGAAVLARDMTKIADMDSFRKAIYLAMEKLYKSSGSAEFPMNYLYPAFVEVASEKKLRFFYGKELDKFEEDKAKIGRLIERNKKLGRETDYTRLQGELNTPCAMYQADLIELFCSPTMHFHNLGLGYLVPLKEKIQDALYDIGESSLAVDEFEKIFLAFICLTFTDSFCFDNLTPESVRIEVKYIKGNRYGFDHYEPYINQEVKNRYPSFYKKIYEAILSNFFRKENEYYFLNLQTVKIVLTENDEIEWVRCKRCGEIQPFALYDRCSACEANTIEKHPIKELKQIAYWRKPIFSEEDVKSLNTEEHTAQLSFKDQKIETWAKTEDYEMRFQDINVEKETTAPIDILSCTTTMEVGIDIGSLIAIGLRNVPPLRENYQQRAGRAGRRGSSLSTISTYAYGGPHDFFYFNSPEKIIKGKPRKPWIDIRSSKIAFRHFNLVVLSRFFEKKKDSLYDCSVSTFRSYFNEFCSFLSLINFTNEELKTLFVGSDISSFKKDLVLELTQFLKITENNDKKLFDKLFETGILPTYSFPLDVVDFTIEGTDGKTKLAPSRSIDIAINEYAPGRTIVVDKKTYKSAGIYSPILRKDVTNPYKPAEPFFKEDNGFISSIYMCPNNICGWFGKKLPDDGNCPFCGTSIDEGAKRHMLKPWGFAPLNAKDISEAEADSEMTYSDDPCYSATPSSDLKETKYPNLKISNRKDEEIIVLNKGENSEGFDVCRDCGAAQLHRDKSLKENGVGAPFTVKGNRVNCNHKSVEERIFLGTNFRTDMFFMQITIDTEQITDNPLVLKSASVTLCEAMKLSASRILDIEYNDLTVGTRVRSDGKQKFIDIYFYDSLSSGAGYSTQIEPNLTDILQETLQVLNSGDSQDICNFWNQKIQRLFDKQIAKDLLVWFMSSSLPKDFTEEETKTLCVPLTNILQNESKITTSIVGNTLIIRGARYKVIPAFKKSDASSITDFEILQSLPVLLGRISII